MRHHDRRHAGSAQDVNEAGAQGGADFGVEGGEGFVEEEEAGFGRERARERDALALAAGEFAGKAVGDVGEFDEVEQVADAVGRGKWGVVWW